MYYYLEGMDFNLNTGLWYRGKCIDLGVSLFVFRFSFVI